MDLISWSSNCISLALKNGPSILKQSALAHFNDYMGVGVATCDFYARGHRFVSQ
jgi:hypothetical protein